MSSPVVALVLAAGGGKRFRPFVTDKNLFPFLGKPFISHTIGDALPAEVTEIVLVANRENQKQMTAMKFPVPHTVVVQKEGDGMAQAVLAAKQLISGKRLLVVIGDDIAGPDVFRSVMTRAGHRHFGVLPVFQTETYFPGGYIRYQGKQPVEIVEKPKEGSEPSHDVYFGGQYIESADLLVEAITKVKTSEDDVYEKALSALMASHEFSTVSVPDPFVTLKYPWHVLAVTDRLLRQRLKVHKGKKTEIRHNVSIEGPVYIGDNVRIFENTKIAGPCYIGDDTIIGSNNIIRESYIGRNCVTGFNTDIARSYIGDHCWFHSNYIGDSVLEGNISMGSGTVLANLRLDEGEIFSVVRDSKTATGRTKLGAMIAKNVRIGVNASIMPGVKIGSGSMIGAGVVLDRDVPEETFCAAKPGYVVKKNTKTIQAPEEKDGYKSRL